MADTNYDIAIIGSGPGGYVAAIRAAQLGFRTAIVEGTHLGGICLNWGCIPTKALLRSAEIYGYMQHAERYGLSAQNLSYDTQAVVKRSRAIAAQLSGGVAHLLRKNKIDVIWGRARLGAGGAFAVSEAERGPYSAQPPKGALGPGSYAAGHVVVATGARPRVLPGIEPDREKVWTYFEAMAPQAIPKSLLVIGSGAIGIEFASFFRTMGAEVTVVELLPQILPVEDEDVARFAQKQLEKAGITFMLNAKVAKLDKTGAELVATVESEGGKTELLRIERVISAAGVVGNVEGLGLEELGIKMERGIIATDGFGRTNVAGIYAIGDIAGPPMLAHKAEHEGVVCVETIKGLHTRPLDKLKVPGCTYCQPQVASVGLTERRAREGGREVRIGKFPFVGNGKAIALGEPDGFVKTIFDAGTGELIGAHLVGAEVTELIQGFVIAMNCETTEEELIHAVFPHPTLSEMMHESVMDAYGRVVHM